MYNIVSSFYIKSQKLYYPIIGLIWEQRALRVLLNILLKSVPVSLTKLNTHTPKSFYNTEYVYIRTTV